MTDKPSNSMTVNDIFLKEEELVERDNELEYLDFMNTEVILLSEHEKKIEITQHILNQLTESHNKIVSSLNKEIAELKIKAELWDKRQDEMKNLKSQLKAEQDKNNKLIDEFQKAVLVLLALTEEDNEAYSLVEDWNKLIQQSRSDKE